jgi:acyl-CoA-binding protein
MKKEDIMKKYNQNAKDITEKKKKPKKVDKLKLDHKMKQNKADITKRNKPTPTKPTTSPTKKGPKM